MKLFAHIVFTVVMMIAWAALVFIGTVDGWFHKPIAAGNDHKAFVESVDREIGKTFVGNFAMAIFDRGVVHTERFHSVGQPVDRNTVFQVSSLSKWVSAFGVMTLVEQGKLDLDTPVEKYLTRWKLPDGEFDNREVTVRRLLSHTAGLTDGLGYSGFETTEAIQSLEQSLTNAADADPGVSGSVVVGLKPGAEFRYSGGGYTLLQLIVEEVSGNSFASYMHEAVFEPLGMIHSTYVWDEAAGQSLAGFYNSDGTAAKHYRYTALAATSLYTSLSDLELFFQAHWPGKHGEPIGRHVLKPETIAQMRMPHGQEMGVDIWGLGTILFAETGDNDFIIGHDGKSSPPINTAARLDPYTGNGIIVLETGHASIATRLASEWVFWSTGKVDTLLFPSLMNIALVVIGGGWVIVIGISIFVAVRSRRRVEPKKI